ncbi:MAG TPA: hypothetical protein VKZ75_05535, partial [Cyclobacteriaceae bacterium]|nr:hypothetical protein [Cyclobacteriaceae bacterium]
IAWRKGKSGIIDFNNSVRIPFRYDGFVFWNDSSAWARDGDTWKIIDLKKGAVLVDAVGEFSIASQSDKEVIVIARRGSDFGVLSSTRGVLIPIEYTEVVNVGTSDSPLFFTEKHVREADLSVVVYYDAQGNPVRRQSLDPEEFDQLACDR